ncbi:MAG: DUF1080 domain-containing protein [Bacteroidota bacterium]
MYLPAQVRTRIGIGVSILLLSCLAEPESTTPWTPLFNGRNLDGWDLYLSIPDSSLDVPEWPRNQTGAYQTPLKAYDPLGVYTIVDLPEGPALRISGAVVGNLYSTRPYANYHLRARFKWGDIKWPWMQGRPKDGGILYHYQKPEGLASHRHEFQIHAGDVGSYWARRTRVEIPGRLTSELPSAIIQAKPFLLPLVPNLGDTMAIFDPTHPPQSLAGNGQWAICLAHPLNEQPEGEWNTLELICYQNHAVHIVNGKINMVILNAHYQSGDSLLPINQGLIQFQSEGAELFFRNVEIRQLHGFPDVLRSYQKAGWIQ